VKIPLKSRHASQMVFSMKAIVVKKFGEPEALQIEETPQPRPAAGQVLVRVHAVGVNPIDTYIRAGTYPKLPALPYTPGTDGAGVVEQIGEGIKSLATGDRVWFLGTSTGSYAEYALCAEDQVHPLPERVSYAQGAAVGVPHLAAYRALFQRAGRFRARLSSSMARRAAWVSPPSSSPARGADRARHRRHGARPCGHP